MMKAQNVLSTGILLIILLIVSGCRLEPPYREPSPSLNESDLVGTWEEHYPFRGVDRLILRGDGSFKQICQDQEVKGYVYETTWNRWWLEQLPTGHVRVHLSGARYYAEGRQTAEMDGKSPFSIPTNAPQIQAWDFHDPITGDTVTMLGELVLSVQVTSWGEPVLLHMKADVDAGYIILSLGFRAERFRRVESPRGGR